MQLNITVWPTKNTDIVSTPTTNFATREGEVLNTTSGSPFRGVNMTMSMVTAQHLDSIVAALVHTVLSLNVCSSELPRVMTLDVCTNSALYFVKACSFVPFFFPILQN